jgi:hypothetical protein
MIPVLNPSIFMPAKRPPAASARRFKVASQYQPAGDQPQAIAALTEGVWAGLPRINDLTSRLGSVEDQASL